MTIYFLRHASAGERQKDPRRDERRPLDRSGIEQCVRIGRTMAALEIHLDAIVTSPLKRATQTAALVGNEIGHEAALVVEPALRPDAAYAAFQQMTEKYANREAILVVGHNPNLAQFLGRIIGDHGRPARVELRKGALAKVEMARTGGSLQWLLTPKLARAAAPSPK